MRELSRNELLNINGGSAIVVCTYYGLFKFIKWIYKFINSIF